MYASRRTLLPVVLLLLAGWAPACGPSTTPALAPTAAGPIQTPPATSSPPPSPTRTVVPPSRWTTYTTADGLAYNGVSAIAAAPDGALWFGTAGLEPSSWGPLVSTEGAGVSRFEVDPGPAGGRWTHYGAADGLAGNTVRSIAVAADGTLWFGCEYGGISQLDGETWTTYTMTAGPTGQIWFLQNSVTSIVEDRDGALWFATQQGVYRFEASGEAGGGAFDERWTICDLDDTLDVNVRVIAVAPDGALWFGTAGHGVFHPDPASPDPCTPETWTHYTRGTTAEELVDNQIYAIAVAPDGALWFGTGAGVSRFDGRTWTPYTTADGLAGSSVWAIAVAPNGALWFGTDGGVSRFDGRTWTSYTNADGLADDNVWAIAVAPDGALWFGTRGGVSRFEPAGY